MQEVNIQLHNESTLPTRAANFCLSVRATRNQDLMFVLLNLPIPILSILINGIVLLAAGLQRKTLRRHNYVFSSVCSTLVSNMLYTVLAVWTAIANYLQIMEDGVNDQDNDVKDFSKKMWVARNAMILSLLLAMCGNIGSLVFVLMDSTYFVGRTVSHGQIVKAAFIYRDELSGRRRIHLTKRAKARLLIVISWIAPMTLVTGSASSDWNCRNLCCPPGYYNFDSCPVEQSCSRLWPPLTQSFLAIVLGVWMVEVMLMIWLLTHTTLRFRKLAGERRKASRTETETNSGAKSDPPPSKSLSPVESSAPKPLHLTLPAVGEPETINRLGGDRETPIHSQTSNTPGTITRRKRARSIRFIQKFNSKMKAMISLTALFFIFTLPLVLGILADLGSGAPMPGKNVFIVFADLSAFLYTTLCPIILLKFMPRLKMSVSLCLYNCSRWCNK